jgi:hypothetical protein
MMTREDKDPFWFPNTYGGDKSMSPYKYVVDLYSYKFTQLIKGLYV